MLSRMDVLISRCTESRVGSLATALPLPINLILRAKCILHMHVYCVRRKEGRGGIRLVYILGQVFVCTVGMLAVPIRLQHRVING